MPIKDRLASLKFLRKTIPDERDVHELNSLTTSNIEEEATNEFLRRVSALREAITKMNDVVELIRQLHNLLKVSNGTRDVDRGTVVVDILSRPLYGRTDLKVDRIDTNVAQAAEYTEMVKKETDEAIRLYQLANQKSALVFLIFVVLALVIILLLSTLVRW
ncbi:hypothetical protein KIN20_027649 [Parelaphostrongylus tenuis]|uniref:t-SNARE coiled-coil homology domain-containing protein n=1 Tax=Parelaphostrongylus tenuis TaxID=148309 RepID=A0AAD5QQD7_PARTN|nr:hypothetical protein KIN20_016021 [Parelaphostrongylus tenuis]KAJ1366868.1 hypothetical protein KIN20_027649 [Parelaphostrongylus tenuis]